MVEAPGPGSWVLDTTHFTGPVTRFTREVFSEPTERGFRDGTRPYGILLDHIAWGFVGHWPYLSPRPVADLGRAGVLSSAADWERLVAASPALGARVARAEAVFQERTWRADLQAWDERVKPEAIAEHERLGRVDPGLLSAGELVAHVEECRGNLQHSLYCHHRFNVAAVIAVGDFLVAVERWSGRTGPDVLAVLAGANPVAFGPEDRVDAVARYIERVRNLPVGGGTDIGDPCLAEVPEVLLRNIVAAVEGSAAPAGDAAAADLRRAVPAGERATFDGLLAEARDSYRLRDERATFCDVWAFGLMRRGVLAGGFRLAGEGRLHDPRQLLEAGYDELRALLGGATGVHADELAERAQARATATFSEVPPFLGGPPREPVPLDWLPAGAARTEGAFRAYMAAMSADGADPPDDGAAAARRGVAASRGCYEGTARVVGGPDDLARVQEGDVLVAHVTSPAFNVVVPFVGAIVTDTGGVLSHAAIVAREYGIPAVVGTADATRGIPDGARVRVDGDQGEVSLVT